MVGRYVIYGEIAKGGMATVHFGRLLGPVGFSRTVAIKRLHPHYASDAEFVAMFLDEARLAARIQHPNVVQTLDIVTEDNELMLVMEYVQGESLSRMLSALRARTERVPWRVIAAIMNGILSGLHAAHEAKNERGEPLGIVHRDMSPQNVLVGADGVVRVFDFGIAKAAGRAQDTRAGTFKGKLAYAAPEQLAGREMDRRVDVYAASVMLWEMVTGRRMFKADDEMQLYAMVREGRIEPPGSLVGDLPAGLEAIIMRGLATDPAFRFASAREMAIALEEVLPHGSTREMAEWVGSIARQVLEHRAKMIEEIETTHPLWPTESGIRDMIPTLVRPAPTSGVPTSRPPSAPRPSSPAPSQPASVPPQTTASGQLPAASSASFEASPAEPRRRRGAVVLALLLVVLAAVGGGAFAYLRTSGEPTVVEEPQTGGDKPAKAKTKPATKVAEAPAKPEPEPPPETATTTLSNAPPPKAPPPPSKPVAAPVTAPVTAAPAKPTAASKPTAAPKSSAATANCSPPFTIDQDGIRHPKPECM
ncbi:MAG: serine/threonine protein kinase [Deltaproteobacteria bacterium]|nr:serine/threonine protein kinase [Deltaproteobacteria bacterium]